MKFRSKPLLIVGTILLLVGIGIAVAFMFINKDKSPAPAKIHIHAAYHVYLDDKLVDFNGNKFMHTVGCSLNPQAETTDPAEIQEEKAHLHDRIGDVVHVHRTGALWGDLFTNLDYPFPAEKEITTYINGQKIAGDILTTEIKEYDRVLILIGGENADLETRLQNIPSIDRIKEVEKKSESCGS